MNRRRFLAGIASIALAMNIDLAPLEIRELPACARPSADFLAFVEWMAREMMRGLALPPEYFLKHNP